MITDKKYLEFVRHSLFDSLRFWGYKMYGAYKEHNYRMIEYYEGVIYGTFSTMMRARFISFNTFEILYKMLINKREELRGEFEC